jgi:excisionase family DNA binding protein
MTASNVIVMDSSCYQNLMCRIDELYKLIASTKESKEDRLLEVKEVAKKLKVSDRTIRNYIEQGKLKAVDFNSDSFGRSTIKVLESDVKDFIQSNRR